ncbi:MAG: 4'-phosphopantetheinyl transferase superfamily protein [Planctomycetes bacterium]|nr:4'-phosphopantetheinyl transferase superfamily protein [Planctomycetota bacterium]
MSQILVAWLLADRARADVLAAAHDGLDDEERARAARFANASTLRDFVLGRWLMRSELAKWTGALAAGWRFPLDAHGRPIPRHRDRTAPDTPSINLSHGGGLVAVVVASDGPVGIDVESVDRELPSRRLDRFLSQEEHAALAGLEPLARRERFWRIWTLKEALLKARGTGIAGGLASIAFGFDHADRPCILRRDGADDDAVEWRLVECRPTETTRLSIACGGIGAMHGEVRVERRTAAMD